MGYFLAIAIGLVIWVVGWSFGLKSFDMFLITILVLVICAAVHATAPFVRKLIGPDPDA